MSGCKCFTVPLVYGAIFAISILGHVGRALTDSPNVPDSELSALQDLYTLTSGNDWQWFQNETTYGIPWNFTNPNVNPCSERWQGITCTPLYTDGFLHVESLTLFSFNMVGALPPSLGSLTAMRTVDFAANILNGTIPAAFGEMRNLSSLDLGYNQLTGTIPLRFNDLDNLQTLFLNGNLLNGSLPTLDSCTKLSLLVISENQLTGAIPSTYANFMQLSVLRLGDNLLHGPIPAFLGNLINMTFLGLNKNAFTGTLPDLSRLTKLASLAIALNQLHGTVPAYFGRLPNLQQLLLTSNHFTGSIPADLCKSITLQQLYLNYNQLTGSLPEQLDQVGTLTSLRVESNKLTGKISAGIADLTLLTILSLGDNGFTGTLPANLGNLQKLESFDASDNMLTGTIPASVCQLTAMLNFTASGCYLSGSIPNEIGHMTALQYLALFDNLLTSTLPASLKFGGNLTVLLLHNNQLTGCIAGAFDPLLQPHLTTVQLSENRFTGDLPVALFELPGLETVILGTNCFAGTLPEAICNASQLQTLSLNGLVSGAACRKPLFPKISEAYLTYHPIRNGLPPCLFEMTSLNTLQVCGNGITGTLPANVQLGPNLIALALSHNKLTGTIPHVFQHRKWFNLDLSSNKLKGTLCAEFASIPPVLTDSPLQRLEFPFNRSTIGQQYISTAAVALSDNRLSYRVPTILRNMHNISVLKGNLFGCNLDHSDLPQHDGAQYAYTCGSNSFNASYSALMVCVGLVVVAVALFYCWQEKIQRYVDISKLVHLAYVWISFSHLYRNEMGQPIMQRYESVLIMADELCKIGLYCTAFILLLQLPFYCLMNQYYGTHTYEYAWSVSAAFLSGDAAASFLIASFAVLLILLLYLFKRAIAKLQRLYGTAKQQDPAAADGTRRIEEDREATPTFRKALILTAYLTVNLFMVGLVHVGYVYAVMNGTSVYKTLAQLALSAFRLVWSTYGSQYLLRGVQSRLAKSEEDLWRMKGARAFALQLLVQLLNAVVIPCVVVLAISPDCFHYALVSATEVTSHYYYDDCQVYGSNFGCLVPDYRLAATTFSPPFTYSYECSASLITFYAPAFVYTGLFVSFLTPLIDFGRRYLFVCVPRESRWFWIVDAAVPKILRPVNARTVQYDKLHDPQRPYFDGNFLLLVTVSYLGLLLTFGFVFPPLAFVLLLAMYSTVYLSRLHVGRFLSDAVADSLHHYSALIEKECVGISWRFLRCVRVVVAVMTAFYALFVFDAIGDAHGAKDSFLIVIAVFAVPLALWGIVALNDWYHVRAAGLQVQTADEAGVGDAAGKDASADIELSDVVVSSAGMNAPLPAAACRSVASPDGEEGVLNVLQLAVSDRG